LLSRSFPAGAGADPTHDLPKGSGLNAIRPITFLEKASTCASVWLLSCGRAIHSRMIFRRSWCSGFMSLPHVCATNSAAPPAVGAKQGRPASGERNNACQVRATLRSSIVQFAVVFVQKARDFPAKRCGVQESPIAPALSKSSRCSFRGKVPHCMIKAAPRHRRICSSSCARRSLAERCGHTMRPRVLSAKR
jgi:hypothetical protein